MRASVLLFAIASGGLLCADCLAQTNSSSSTNERTAASGAGSTDQSMPAVQPLELKKTIPLAYPAPSVFGSGTKCDRNGNIFVPVPITNSDGTLGSIVLLEILPDSTSTRIFGSHPLSVSDYPNNRVEYFDVDASGTVYALVDTHENVKTGDKQQSTNWQYYIERFNSDGSTDSVVHLGYPPGADPGGLNPYQFGTFRGGSFVLTGTLRAPSTGFEPFVAVYDSNGEFIQNIALPDDVPDDRSLKAEHASSAQRDSAISAIMLGSMVSSPDGNVYLLRNSQPVRLYGVGVSGEVVKHFQLSLPSPGLNVFSAGIAGEDSLLLYFAHPPPQHPGEKPVSKWLAGVFNTVSRQFEAVYQLPPNMLGIPACGDQHGDLLFIGGTADHHLAVFDYAP